MQTADTYSAPGKVFLLGEYAVLAGLPAWLVATSPRFRLALDRAGTRGPLPFSPESPAGRLFADAVRKSGTCAGYSWHWKDPHHGEGGFGASSAQFILLYRALAPELGWPVSQEHALEIYHAFHRELPMPPSGADIAAQWVGGSVRFDKAAGARRVPLNLDPDRILLFSATGISGRKIKTHEHLYKLGRDFFDVYRESFRNMERVLRAFDDRLSHGSEIKMDELGEFLDDYAHELSRSGLEAPGATEDRLALRAHPGVSAVKGTGAGLSDAIWVVLNPSVNSNQRQDILRLAETRGLKTLPLSVSEAGITEGS